MAHFLKSLSLGRTTWFLSTNGRDIFHSRLYSTGGVVLPQVICRDGRILDRQTLLPVADADLVDILTPTPGSPRLSWSSLVGRFGESLQPRRRQRELRFNPAFA